MITRNFINKLIDSRNMPTFVPYVDLVTWNKIRAPTPLDTELSEDDANLLFEYLSEEDFFHTDHLTNGIFTVIYNLQCESIFLSQELIGKQFDTDSFNRAVIFYTQTTDENIKLYLKMKWSDF